METIRNSYTSFTKNISYKKFREDKDLEVGKTIRKFQGTKYILIEIICGDKCRLNWAHFKQWIEAHTIDRKFLEENK